MTCTCPKCHAKIELDLPEVTETGTSASCPACSARFTVHRESFGGRALRKSSEISCATCGAEIGPDLHCLTCGAQYPDYFVVGLGRKKVRRVPQKVKLKVSPFPQKSAAKALPSLDGVLHPEPAKAAFGAPGALGKRQPIAIAIIVLLLAGLAWGGTSFYLKNKAEKAYTKSFVLASYCLQTGIERAQKGIAKKSAEWKAQQDAGQPYSPRATSDDERDLGIINSRLDPAMAKLSRPPKKFASGSEKLSRLQGVYNKMRTLVLNPGNSLQAFNENASKLDAEYKQAVKLYKTEVPEEILTEVTSASLKFKVLRALVR